MYWQITNIPGFENYGIYCVRKKFYDTGPLFNKAEIIIPISCTESKNVRKKFCELHPCDSVSNERLKFIFANCGGRDFESKLVFYRYCQSLPWTNTLAYYRIRILRIHNVL
jgi:hypothetical protein